jgi:hypothetical protein
MQSIQYFFLAFLLSGCWATTIPHQVPDSFADPYIISSLIGEPTERVIEQLGLPNLELMDENQKYMIYHTLGDGTDVMFLIWIPIPIPDFGDRKNDSTLHCLRFEIDSNNLVVGFKLKSGGRKKWFSTESHNQNCLEFFWSKKEIRNFQSLSAPLLEQYAEYPGLASDQLELFNLFVANNPRKALRWRCKAADQGNADAEFHTGFTFEHGHWGIQPNLIQAYVWHSRSSRYRDEWLPSFVDRYLNSEQLARAKQALIDWKPGQCEKFLVFVEDT